MTPPAPMTGSPMKAAMLSAPSASIVSSSSFSRRAQKAASSSPSLAKRQ